MKAKLWIPLILLFGCAGGLEQQLEEIQFHLDKGEFQVAVTQARQAVADAPTSTEAKFLLASALLGESVLTPSAHCKPGDTGYLGLLACLQDSQRGHESAFVTFARIAPTVEDTITSLEEARDILIGLTSQMTGNRLQDTYLQLWIARLFEISGVTTRIGLCTSQFNAAGLDGADIDRFQDNLNHVNGDGDKAGLPESAALSDRIIEVGTALSDAVTAAGGDEDAGAQAFFAEQNSKCE